MADAKMLNKVPVREQDPKVRATTLKKFVLDIIRKKQWKRHRDVWAVKNRNA